MKKIYFKYAMSFLFASSLTTAHAQMRGNTQKTLIQDQNSNWSVVFQEHGNAKNNLNQQPSLSEMMAHRGTCPDTAFFEDFQSKVIPASFGNYDLDGATDANGRPQDWYVPFDAQNTTPGDTNWVAAASSWFSPFGTANNWLTTGPISVCGSNMDLFWKSAPFEGLAYMDGYSVYISTTGNTPADFTGSPVFTLAEDINGSGTPGPGTVHSQFNGNNGVLEEYMVDLSAYAGQTIYIGYHHNSNDDNLIMLDDIFVGSPVTHDLNIVSSEIGSDYTITPLTQVQMMQYGADVELIGPLAVTNPTLSVNLWDGSSTVFSNSPTQPTQSGGSVVSYSATTGFSPSTTGNYEVRYAVTANEIDPILTNNYDTAYFEVSDSVYARDNGNYTGDLSVGAGTSGMIGNQFDLVAADDITSITFYRDTVVIGDTIVAHVYDISGAQPNTIVASTDTVIATANASAAYHTLDIAGGFVNLTAGSYAVVVEERISSSLRVGTETDNYMPQTTWVLVNGSWDHAENFGFSVVFAVRANFGVACVDPVGDFSNVSTNLNVNFTDMSTSQGSIMAWSWDFGDGNTSTMQNPVHTYTSAGTYTVCLTVTDACGTDVVCNTVVVSTCPDPVSDWSGSTNNLVVTFTDASTSVNAISAWLWDFGDGNTSTMQNPVHTYAADGNYTACLTVSDACGSDSTCMTMSVVDGSVSVEENDLIGLTIYPNPAQAQVVISSRLMTGKIILRDAIGKVLSMETITGNNTVVDLSHLAGGVYFVEVSDGEIRSVRRLIKE